MKGMTPRSSHAPPAPLVLQKQKSKSSLRGFFSSSGSRNTSPVTPVPPVTPPATPRHLSESANGTISPAPSSNSSKDSTLSLRAKGPSYSSYAKPPIPQVVFTKIALELRVIHGSGPLGAPCDTCFMRDLCSLALVNKRFSKGALRLLYSKIRLHGPDSENSKFHFGSSKKNAIKYGARINLLCRTLRSRPDFAELVVELKLPAYDLSLPGPEVANIHSLAAGVVMCCPNLEKLVGFYPTFEFGMGIEVPGNPKDEEWRRGSDRLWQALSTRKKLKEHVWLLVGEQQFEPSPDDIGYLDENGVFRQEVDPLPQQQIQRFLSYHAQWQNLETLVLHGMNTISSLLPHDFMALFQYTPNLGSLYASHFAYYQFTDEVLWYLPKSLTALRLECLPGLTDRSLSFYFSSPQNPLKKLSLINLDIRSLLLIMKIFANLAELDKFTLLQENAPEIDETDTLFLRPLLASRSLRFLHWDCLNSGPAEVHLANSITDGGFPKLQYLRAPCDNKGILQAVCRPREKIELPGDKFRSLIVRQTPQKTKQAANGYTPTPPERRSRSSSSSRHHRSRSSSSTAITTSLPPMSPTPIDAEELTRHLPTARSKAQKRLEVALNPPSAPNPPGTFSASVTARRPKTSHSSSDSMGIIPPLPTGTFHIHIIISNFDGPKNSVKDIVTYHGYMGTINSKVEYFLLPDIPGSESALAGLGDIMEAGWEWKEPGTGSSDGCTGLVNVRNAVNNGGNGKAMHKYWSHRERWPWRMIALGILF
ncbi:hypothetical protein TWF106_010044 [Orbilia oligospora]|uniref:F-box domain-containing protein n=1 Tax=Orbilia oligospora TaxID=2813651 RepID=A0A6G1LXB5_ORBOL|nr:hypothetical protein TWF788_009665 [Orbilia oligospora]KAF3203196.1 hypothetical protein TWF679_010506 [Orbilia oligospora]KAF3212114.1 hypothetical protein TWF106_010044 [Orbilia oligospora]KAF3231692.1 hypothetical protein TWF191_005752 [Orbilia oligospora]KAF3236567.1 hypothetical protein TWF192_011401 [Orbilia oligospora]